MANERVYSHRLTIATIAAMLLVAATVSMATTESADAYAINQAKSDVNECGNGDTPTNVGCQNSDSQIQGDNNSPSIASSQSVQRETPTGFTVTGSGTVSSETILCLLGPATPDPTLEVEFEVQSDGTTSGTYTLSITDTSGERTIREGVITFGTTDGNIYTFGGEGLAFCGDFEGGISVLPMSISGDCGDGVTVHYGDLNTGEITFTGDVECTLTQVKTDHIQAKKPNKTFTIFYQDPINPSHNKLITVLRTAVENEEGSLDKEIKFESQNIIKITKS